MNLVQLRSSRPENETECLFFLLRFFTLMAGVSIFIPTFQHLYSFQVFLLTFHLFPAVHVPPFITQSLYILMPGFQIIAPITAEILLDSGEHDYSLTSHRFHKIARTLKKVYEPSWSRTCSNGDPTQQDAWKTQDDRMTKKCCVRMGMRSLARHFLDVMSLPAVLLHKFSNTSSHRSDCMETKYTFSLILNSLFRILRR